MIALPPNYTRHKTVSEQTETRLLLVLEAARTEPLAFDMGTWFTNKKGARTFTNPCGTAACLAGTATLLFGPTPQNKPVTLISELDLTEQKKRAKRPRISPMELGRRILFLEVDQAQDLFIPDEWPERFFQRYENWADKAIDLQERIEDQYAHVFGPERQMIEPFEELRHLPHPKRPKNTAIAFSLTARYERARVSMVEITVARVFHFLKTGR